ncbi:MAG: elongation factor Ts [Steroidobacteraceae bacterium]|nr:elongation factor Ts [Steroidobacteraceae bacterium]MCC7199020.1 elongation factor Ts [Gammaproteobacteria bacterium]
MAITADAVKTLRERTGAGMMECKKALTETNGDLEAASELMRKAGLAKADKKASRIAAEGAIVVERSADGRTAVMLEINSETDFVARQDEFKGFGTEIAKAALAAGSTTLEQVLGLALASGATVEDTRRAMIARIGENITVRRVVRVEAPTVVGAYVHGTRIGTLVAVKGGDEPLARDLAMHVAASNPQYVAPANVPAEVVNKEREILIAQAAQDEKNKGKPVEILARISEGRIRKFLDEICLVGQPFVKDPDTSVEKLLKTADASVASFVRFEVGEGIEKKQGDFAAEVMAQVKAAGG